MAGSIDMFPDAVVEFMLQNQPEVCEQCSGEIHVMAYRGTGVCSVLCARAAGRHVSSVGTMMFVTTEEKADIVEKRNG